MPYIAGHYRIQNGKRVYVNAHRRGNDGYPKFYDEIIKFKGRKEKVMGHITVYNKKQLKDLKERCNNLNRNFEGVYYSIKERK